MTELLRRKIDLVPLLNNVETGNSLVVELTTAVERRICRISLRKLGKQDQTVKMNVANRGESNAALIARTLALVPMPE